MEIKLTSKTNIGQSPKKFDSIAEPSNSPAAPTPVSQIHKMGNFDRVDLKVKISQVNPPCTVPTGKLKQDLIVADSTGTIKLTLWGNEVGKYDIDSSYQLQQMSIRTYNGYKYLNFPKEGGSSTKIGDIGDVANITDNSQHTSSSDIHNATVGGVSRLFKYKCCIKCRSKAEVTSAKFARCTNASCKMLQKLDMAKDTFSAVLMIASPDTPDKEVHAFEKELCKIADMDTGEVGDEDLLEALLHKC